MKILIVTQYFWPEEFRINDCATELLARGHEVTVLTGVPNYPKGNFFPGYGWMCPKREDYHGVKIIRIPLIARGKKQGWRLALNYLSFALLASLFGPLYLRGRRFDVIFAYEPSPVTVGIPAIVLKRIKRAPLLFWVQDLWPESITATGFVHSKVILAFVGKLVRWIYRCCDRILIQSKGFFEPVISQGGEAARIVYLPNWAEGFYQPVIFQQDAAERKSVPEGFVVMFAGNMGVAQDFPTILSAAETTKERQDIHWVILGDGSMKEWVAQEIHARGLWKTVHLLGRHPVETMPRFFSLADVMLVTLKREPIFALTIPGKVQSYLACGRPIIAGLDGEGGRVIRESDAGIACPSESPDALAAAVLKMAQMPAVERHEMGQRGLRYYQANFERRMIMDHLERLMEKAKNL